MDYKEIVRQEEDRRRAEEECAYRIALEANKLQLTVRLLQMGQDQQFEEDSDAHP